ncbi:hypothetical protein, partial [Roseateles sp.]|uniref:hypothetical protein n=1 Tax=Roseateles sp. TaxID=1971397 RepID=UPI002DF80F66|nr:hypothetical protein [Roseateles sp.]
DSWHRELLDAARFDPAGGDRVLWTPARLARERCSPGRLWLVAPPDAAPPDARPVSAGRRASLYELPRPAVCP